MKPIRILPTRERVYECARPCVKNWLLNELKWADPKIIFTIGEEAAQVVHGYYGDAPTGFFEKIVGTALKAGENENNLDRRTAEFFRKNVFHFIHPGTIVSSPDDPLVKDHWAKHLPAAFGFMKELGIRADRDEVGGLSDEAKEELEAAQAFAGDIDHGE